MLKLAGVWHLNLQTFKLTINEPLYPLWKNSQYQSVYLELCFCIKPKAYVTALNWPALEMFLDVWYHYTTWKSTHLPTTFLYTGYEEISKKLWALCFIFDTALLRHCICILCILSSTVCILSIWLKNLTGCYVTLSKFMHRHFWKIFNCLLINSSQWSWTT